MSDLEHTFLLLGLGFFAGAGLMLAWVGLAQWIDKKKSDAGE